MSHENLLTVSGVIERRTEAATHPDHVIFHWRRAEYKEPGIVDLGFYLPKSTATGLKVGDIVQITVARAALTKSQA